MGNAGTNQRMESPKGKVTLLFDLEPHLPLFLISPPGPQTLPLPLPTPLCALYPLDLLQLPTLHNISLYRIPVRGPNLTLGPQELQASRERNLPGSPGCFCEGLAVAPSGDGEGDHPKAGRLWPGSGDLFEQKAKASAV